MRKLFLILAVLAFSLPVQAVTLKIATATPDGTQWMDDMRSGAKEIKERTAGRVQIKYYGGGIKGDDKKVLGQIRIRQLQGGAFTPSALASQYSELNLYGMPLIFDSEEEAAYVRSRLDTRLQKRTRRCGVRQFRIRDVGVRQYHVEHAGQFAVRYER